MRWCLSLSALRGLHPQGLRLRLLTAQSKHLCLSRRPCRRLSWHLCHHLSFPRPSLQFCCPRLSWTLRLSSLPCLLWLELHLSCSPLSLLFCPHHHPSFLLYLSFPPQLEPLHLSSLQEHHQSSPSSLPQLVQLQSHLHPQGCF